MTKLPYESHPYADLFPLNEGPDLWKLADDIKENGLLEKITMWQDKILDGRRRQLACHRAEIKPGYKKFKGTDGEALAFVISRNLHRRHLGEGDRALIAAKVANLKDGQKKSTISAASNEAPAVTQAEAAELLNVSRSAVQRAAAVIEDGSAPLQAAVTAGTVSVSDAAKIVDEPKAVQNAAVAAVVKGEAPTVAAAVAAKKKKSGSPLFDDRAIQTQYGKLIRLTDDRKTAMGAHEEHANCLKYLGLYLAALTRWRKATT